MQPQLLPQQAQPPSTGGPAARLIGCLLLIPAAILTVLTLVIPTLRTIATSTRSESLTSRTESESVGFDNYAAVLDNSQLWSSLGFSLSLMVAPIIVAVLLAPLLAAAVNWAGGWARLTARVLLSVTLVVFPPVALAIAWLRMFHADDPALLGDFDLVRGALRSSVAMMTFGVVLAIGVMVFLPILRAREQRRPMWPTMFAAAGVVTLGLLAVGLQQFTVPYVITRFGPANTTLTPVGLMYLNAFQNARLGLGAAVAVLLLVILAVLGVAAVLIVILTRLRAGLLPLRQQTPASRDPAAIVLAVLVLVGLVVAVVLMARPWLDALSGSPPQDPPGTPGRTWLPAATGAVVSVGVAYLAALGISGLRPLGRHSEWLLLPFAPWLFVGVAPLGIEFVTSVSERDGLGTDAALRPPILISIVSLLVLAILCRGQSQRWQRSVAAGEPAGAAFLRTVVLPTLPLAGLLLLVTILGNAQDLWWPLLVGSPEHGTTVLSMVTTIAATGRADFSLAAATPLLVVVPGVAALAAVQVLHLERMVVTTGEDGEPEPPA